MHRSRIGTHRALSDLPSAAMLMFAVAVMGFYLLFTISIEVLTISIVSIWYFFANSSGEPDSAYCFTPICLTSIGYFSDKRWLIAEPNPFLILWSSAVTAQLVFLTDFKIVSSSSGLIVVISITSASMSSFFNLIFF